MARRIFTVSAVILGLFTSACGGSDGATCQIGSDCKSTLMCCKATPSASIEERGVCATSCTYNTFDAGTVVQDSGVTSSMDAAADAMMSTVDAATGDAN